MLLGGRQHHHDHLSWSAGDGSGPYASAKSSRYFIAAALDLKRRVYRKSSSRASRSRSMSVVTIILSAGMVPPDITIPRIVNLPSSVASDTIAQYVIVSVATLQDKEDRTTIYRVVQPGGRSAPF